MLNTVIIDFDHCPECGSDVEIKTDSNELDIFLDGDQVRCIKCNKRGFVASYEDDIWICWNEI